MQLGGACASGTLFAVGSGQGSVVLTLGGFVAGATLAAWQFDLWKDLPAWEPVVLSDHVGWFGSWAVTIRRAAAGGAGHAARPGPPQPAAPRGGALGARCGGPRRPRLLAAGRPVPSRWPCSEAGVLWVSGGAWGVTSAFSLWGSELVGALGGHPENWTWWQRPGNAEMLAGPVLADKTSLTDLGIMIGAAVAASVGGTWALHRGIPWRTALAAVLGGVLMGVGARLAGGCNIGAYLAGIASGSLSGWLWGAFALAGTWVGLSCVPCSAWATPSRATASADAGGARAAQGSGLCRTGG